MDIAELKENIVEATLDYRKNKVVLKIKPDAEISVDATNAEFLAGKLHDWDLTNEGNKISITKESIMEWWEKVPELMTAINKKVVEVVNAPLGK